jgi:hypothetical protein
MGTFAFFLYFKHLEYDLSSYGWIPVMVLALAVMMSSVGVCPMPYVLAAEMFSVHVSSKFVFR